MNKWQTGRCVKCGKKTRFALSLDLDLPKLYTHKKCMEDVKMALIMITDDQLVKSFTKNWYKPFK